MNSFQATKDRQRRRHFARCRAEVWRRTLGFGTAGHPVFALIVRDLMPGGSGSG